MKRGRIRAADGHLSAQGHREAGPHSTRRRLAGRRNTIALRCFVHPGVLQAIAGGKVSGQSRKERALHVDDGRPSRQQVGDPCREFRVSSSYCGLDRIEVHQPRLEQRPSHSRGLSYVSRCGMRPRIARRELSGPLRAADARAARRLAGGRHTRGGPTSAPRPTACPRAPPRSSSITSTSCTR